jgi:RNA polymerase sigma factor (sigma-70 family)
MDDGATALTDSDRELAERAAGGNAHAFEELYRRHVQSAWRVAQAVTGNRDDAADATSEAFVRVLRALQAGRIAPADHFRPYLMAAARSSAIDILRRQGRTRPVGSAGDRPAGRGLGGVAPGGPVEHLVEGEDAAFVATAFRNLPERWRVTLWLTEVEGLSPTEAASVLGVSANGAAQLAVRARAGLRHRYLQAHLGGQVPESCRYAVERLGSYAGGGLAPRDVAKVDQHLAGCDACRARLAELQDVGGRLRALVLPLPVGLAGAALLHWRKAFAVSGTGTKAAFDWLAQHSYRPLAASCGALLALGIVGLGVVDRQRNPAVRTQAPAAAPAPTGSAATLNGPTAQITLASEVATPQPAAVPVPADVVQATAPVVQPATPAAPAPAPPQPSPPRPTPAPSPPAVPVAQATLGVAVPSTPASISAALGVGSGSCTGASISGSAVGCAPAPAPASSLLSLTTTGSALPAVALHLP